jgi:hypothetical protein
MKQSLVYTLKVWLTALFVGPIPMLFFQNNVGWDAPHYLKEYSLEFAGEIMVFSPLIILCFLMTFWANRKTWTARKKRFVIFLQTELLFLIIYNLFMYFIAKARAFDLYSIEFIIIYGTIIGLGSLFYRINPIKSAAKG